MATRLRDSLLLAAVAAVLLVPAALWRDMDGLEYRSALFVRHIVTEGPTLIPRLYGVPYYDYPALYFLAASVVPGAAGEGGLLPLALPAILSAAMTVFVTALAASAVRRGLGWMAGLALLSTPLFLLCGSQAVVDAMLTFFVTLCLVSYHRYLSSGGAGFFLLACAGIAGGALAKGPVGAALPIAVIVIYLLARRRFRRLAGACLSLGLFLIALGAVVAAAVVMSEGGAALRELADAQVLDRLVDEANQPRLYYAGVFFAGLAPWSILAFIQLFRRGGDEKERGLFLFAKVWLLATFVIFTLARIKHTRYLMPIAPPAAILCAAFWDGYLARSSAPFVRSLLAWVRRLCAAALALGIAGLFLLPVWIPAASAAFTVVLLAAGAAALVYAGSARSRAPHGVFILLAATVVFGFLVYVQLGVPSLDRKTESRSFVTAAEAEAGGEPVVFFAANPEKQGLRYAYWSGREDSISFTDTLGDLEEVLGRDAPALVVAPAEWEGFLRAALGEGETPAVRGRFYKRPYFALCVNGGRRFTQQPAAQEDRN